MKQLLFLALCLISIVGCKTKEPSVQRDDIVVSGQMPNLARDHSGTFHLVYGLGDSILYSTSSDGGESFSTAALVSVLPNLTAAHTRGPQLATTKGGLVLTACNNEGNIFSFVKDASRRWQSTGKVNDVDTVAKENLMALSADGNNVFAVWLDLRDKHNKIFGAKSTDGGRTWLKNIEVYASPDSTVCECCKPSVIVKGDNVYVMFRNWLKGSRDLHLIQSSDGGQTFGQALKLGNGTWVLKGCPMDGGGLAIDKSGNPQTVWNREGKIYASEPGRQEKLLGEGRDCTLETLNRKNVYAWVENGDVVVMQPGLIKKDLGKGQLPIIKTVNDKKILCVWERDKQIHSAVVDL